MISEETWEKFRDGTVVFKCHTQELWDKLMVELEKHGHDISAAKSRYENYEGEGCGIDNESGVLEWCNIGYYESDYPQLEIVDLTDDDLRNLPVPTDSPQPPQGLIDILRTIATCESIEKKYGIQLNFDGLYDKREEYLTKWTSEFEVHF